MHEIPSKNRLKSLTPGPRFEAISGPGQFCGEMEFRFFLFTKCSVIIAMKGPFLKIFLKMLNF